MAATLAATVLTLQPAPVSAEAGRQPESKPAGPSPQTTQESDGHSVTPAQRARMAAEEPLVQAALRIRAAAQTAKASGFAGVALRTGTVTVYWKGAVPPDIRKAIDQESAKVPVAVQKAAYSAEELARAADELTRKMRVLSDRSVVSVGYPVTGTGITATVAGAKTPPALADVKVSVKVVRVPETAASTGRQRTPSIPGSERNKAARPADSGSRTTGTTAVGGWPIPSRQDDATPAWGGAHVINANATGGNNGWKTRVEGTGEVVYVDNKYHCTSGFPVQLNGTTEEAMVGALSCGGPHRTFVDPSGDVVNIPTNGIAVDPFSGISMTVPKGGAEPFIYDGDGWSQTGWQIAGWEAPVAGQSVCVAGAETGNFCDATIGDEVGTQTALISNSQGDSNETRNMTNVHTHVHNGPVWPNRRAYRLADGTPCNGFEFLRDVDEQGCLAVPLGRGDIGAPLYTVPATGTQTGVIIKGILVHQHDGDGQNPNSYHMVGVDKIRATYIVSPLTSANDQP
ncbi:hypothetical protein AB0I85_09245 [Micromonospora echinofusca]|uniref:hypothetical protein n=1 Tax=Micromonospora echinofusca TaxID=47858 RepID=UPI00202039C5|nr:hypothetical protein [Micromonospora sp. MSM11]MCL7456549.1 hypothetical protein [Micromonospora sp. MSM11]